MHVHVIIICKYSVIEITNEVRYQEHIFLIWVHFLLIVLGSFDVLDTLGQLLLITFIVFWRMSSLQLCNQLCLLVWFLFVYTLCKMFVHMIICDVLTCYRRFKEITSCVPNCASMCNLHKISLTNMFLPC